MCSDAINESLKVFLRMESGDNINKRDFIRKDSDGAGENFLKGSYPHRTTLLITTENTKQSL